MLIKTEKDLENLLFRMIKMEDDEVFISTAEYDEEMARNEHISEKVRKEREL